MAKILIIDDDENMRRVYQTVLSASGYEIVTALDGVDGLARVMDEKPALILMDIMMPKINGLDVLDRIKMNTELKRTPVIMLTNMSGEKVCVNALAKGASRCLIKDQLDSKDLVRIVAEVLEEQKNGKNAHEDI
jgi:CheY-like chemotaxis protein